MTNNKIINKLHEIAGLAMAARTIVGYDCAEDVIFKIESEISALIANIEKERLQDLEKAFSGVRGAGHPRPGITTDPKGTHPLHGLNLNPVAPIITTSFENVPDSSRSHFGSGNSAIDRLEGKETNKHPSYGGVNLLGSGGESPFPEGASIIKTFDDADSIPLSNKEI